MKENRMEGDDERMEVDVMVLPFKRRKLRKNDEEDGEEGELKRNGGEEDGELWRPSHWCFAGADTIMSRYSSSFDWAATSLGPVETWSPCLWYSVSVCLTSRFPMVLWLGEDLHLFYNDAYAPVMGDRHPSGFGVPGRIIFHEIWGTIGQQLKTVQDTKKATWSVDQLLIMFRHGYMEETYWTYSYSPLFSAETISNPNAQLEGVFTAVEDTTLRYLSERRLRTLRDLSAQATQAKTRVEVGEECMKVLAENRYDIPFAGCYLYSEDQSILTLGSSFGISPSSYSPSSVLAAKVAITPHSPSQRETAGERDGQQIFNSMSLAILAAQRTKEFQIVDITKYSLESLPPWNEVPRKAIVLPLTTSNKVTQEEDIDGSTNVVNDFGVLVMGVNTRRALDESYLTFFQLVASQMTGSLITAYSHEAEKKRADSLAELDRAKTVFFTNISHEFRTPLTLMLGPIEELDIDTRNEELFGRENMEKIHLLHRNALRLLKLVNVLLDFSRIEAGRMRATFRPVDLSRLTADLASVFRSACEKAKLSLIVNCPPLNVTPYVDSDLWEKIVLNLLSNAFKFTMQGSIEINLSQSYRPEFATNISSNPNCLVMSVSDTGCGIPQSEMPRLFERFHRVQSQKGRSFEGTGIGLALVFELVKLHGGLIKVQSKEDEGSQFVVTIPLGKNHISTGRIIEEPLTSTGNDTKSRTVDWWIPTFSSDQESTTTAETNHGKNMEDSLPPEPINPDASLVLVVDDNGDMLQYVTRILRERHQVIQATDGEKALDILRKRRGLRLPDLVLSDVMMPKIDGFELLRLIQADQALRDIPVVFLSARAGEEALSEGITVGADDYLVKPFSAKELLARVNARIELSKFRLAAARQEQVLRKEAEDANNAKDRFLAVLSHELRTPLTPVLLLAEEAQRNMQLSDRIREDMSMIARNVRLETQLIDDLLDLTKISQQKLQLHLQLVDAHQVLRQSLDLVIHSIHEKQLHLDLTLSAPKKTIRADPARLQQIFWNLLGNAIKFTSLGSISVKTSNVSSSSISDFPLRRSSGSFPIGGDFDVLQIEVSDSGIGIDQEVLPKLFTAFEQGGDCITQKFGGLGLGLNISRALTSMHGGTLAASSEGKNRGATFIVRLPLQAEGIDSGGGGESKNGTEPCTNEGRKKSPEPQFLLDILLVEDNQMTCMALTRFLSARLGHTVTTAGSKSQAEVAIREKKFDLIFCDLGLPDGTGFDLLPVIQEVQPETPAICLTGYGSDNDMEHSAKAGFVMHLTKPVQLTQLEEAIHKHARITREDRDLR